MKYMIGFPIAWVLSFLTFVFINFAWDASTWSSADRTVCAICGIVWGAALSYRISQDCTWSY
jgi:hypothetical protein